MTAPKIPYTKCMIDLIHQIRGSMPSELKPGVRFSNPDLLNNIIRFYFLTNDKTIKKLIANLLEEVGDSWYDGRKIIDPPIDFGQAGIITDKAS